MIRTFEDQNVPFIATLLETVLGHQVIGGHSSSNSNLSLPELCTSMTSTCPDPDRNPTLTQRQRLRVALVIQVSLRRHRELLVSVRLTSVSFPVPGTHSLRYFYTGVSEGTEFPEFVTVGMVDDVQHVYYDSVTKKTAPKQDWMAKSVGPEYWERETQNLIGTEQTFKVDLINLPKRFNQTGGGLQLFPAPKDDIDSQVSKVMLDIGR
ncbi:UNVERIFIED_CONTAM: hypothetical protein FKN15_056516 [Acipenser sinensis]